jgi:predicted lipoprotein with Yx(FWY)xxD motif
MKRSLPAVAIPVVALAVAALGSSSSAAVYSPAPATGGSTAKASSAAKVELSTTKLGKVLATSSGRTLYMFGADKGHKSSCFGACAKAWPPLTTHGKPKAGKGVSASKLGTISRGGGVKQVTYNGHPVYRFQGDTGARQANGEGINAFGGIWHALSAKGKAV